MRFDLLLLLTTTYVVILSFQWSHQTSPDQPTFPTDSVMVYSVKGSRLFRVVSVVELVPEKSRGSRGPPLAEVISTLNPEISLKPLNSGLVHDMTRESLVETT